jgi:hypothetical protein
MSSNRIGVLQVTLEGAGLKLTSNWSFFFTFGSRNSGIINNLESSKSGIKDKLKKTDFGISNFDILETPGSLNTLAKMISGGQGFRCPATKYLCAGFPFYVGESAGPDIERQIPVSQKLSGKCCDGSCMRNQQDTRMRCRHTALDFGNEHF